MRRRRAGRVWVVLRLGDVPCLRTLWTVDDLEFDGLTLFQGPEAVATDRGVMHEHIAATLALNESIALGVVEPLDLACNTHRSSSLLAVGPFELPTNPLDRVLTAAAVSFGAQKKTASAAAASTSTLGNAPQRRVIVSVCPVGVKPS